MTFSTIDPRTVMRERRMNLQQYCIVGLCVLINMIDGYDILALAQAASALKRDWGLSDAALGALLSMNLVGMAIGALGVSPVADQFGRRPAILTCLVFMSVGMAVAALSNGFYMMAIGRIITGIGIGGMTATAGTLALEYASHRSREFTASVVSSAYPVGTILGAYVAFLMLESYGWRAIFWCGASLSAVLFPFALKWLPESLDFLMIRQPRLALKNVNRILLRVSVPEIAVLPPKPEGTGCSVLQEMKQPVHVRELAKLFLAHALNMFTWYFIINWAPPLVAESGGADEQGVLFSSWVSYGGIIGGMTAGFLCGIIGVRQMMWFTMLSLAVLITLFGTFVDNAHVLVVLAPLIGAALFGSSISNWLTIAYAFPPELRATGLGLCSTAGRVGSIFGPIVGGALLNTRSTGTFDLFGLSFDMNLTVSVTCFVMALPAVLSAITFSRARRMEERR